MWNLNKQLPITLISSLLLVACGGGGGDDGGSGNSGGGSSASTPSGSGLVSAPSEQTLNITDLVIEHDNDLTSIYEVDVDVTLPHLAASQVYISICDNAGDGIENIDYEKCMLKSSLNFGYGQYELRIPNHCESLIAVISVMEPDATPLVYTLDHNNEKLTAWLIQ
jgi:hypothetical protein